MKQASHIENAFRFNVTPYSNISKKLFPKYLLIFLPAILFMFLTGCKKNDLKESNQTDRMFSSSLKQESKTRCVPFKAGFTTIDEITQEATDANPVQKDHLTGTGIGTVIGRATEETFAEGDITLPFPALVTSTTTFVAANGDKIFATNDGYLQEPSSNGDVHLTGQGTITGGTGRFAGATGSFEFDATGNIFKPEGAVTFNGTLCYSAE